MKFATFAALGALALCACSKSDETAKAEAEAPAPAAPAEEWVSLGAAGGETASYLASSVVKNGTTVNLTMKADFATPQTEGEGPGAFAFSSITEQVTIDCAAKTYNDLGHTFADASGKQVGAVTTPSGMKPIQSGTPVTVAAEKLCA